MDGYRGLGDRQRDFYGYKKSPWEFGSSAKVDGQEAQDPNLANEAGKVVLRISSRIRTEEDIARDQTEGSTREDPDAA